MNVTENIDREFVKRRSHEEFHVIDTPAIAKTEQFDRIVKQIVERCGQQEERYCAFIVKIGRISNPEIELLDQIIRSRPKHFREKCAIIFTSASELPGSEENKIPERLNIYIKESRALTALVKSHSLQCFAVENMYGPQEARDDFIADFVGWMANVSNRSSVHGQPHMETLATQNSDKDKDDRSVLRLHESDIEKIASLTAEKVVAKLRGT